MQCGFGQLDLNRQGPYDNGKPDDALEVTDEEQCRSVAP